MWCGAEYIRMRNNAEVKCVWVEKVWRERDQREDESGWGGVCVLVGGWVGGWVGGGGVCDGN